MCYKPLSYNKLRKIMEENNYLEPGDLDEQLKEGDKLEILTSYGEKEYWTVTSKIKHKLAGYSSDTVVVDVVARKESGTDKGMEFWLWTSMSAHYQAGGKIIDNFPSEEVSEILILKGGEKK